MKEEDLRKHLDNILIDGLIKEAEQDNADFEAAMRNLSDSSFNSIINEDSPESEEKEELVNSEIHANQMCEEKESRIPEFTLEKGQRFNVKHESTGENIDYPLPSKPKISRWKAFRPWIVSFASAAAVILAVLIPSINSMNARLCDGAIYMSQDYISASKGGLDLSTASTQQIKEEIPSLKQRYESLLRYDRSKHPIISQDCAEAAWDLIVAYLKLHKKGDAVKLLKTLESQTQGTPMGNHCKKLLEQLD